MKRILIVEDDMALAQELSLLLTRNNYEAEYLTGFQDVATQILAKSPDMVLLDINLPGADGQSVLKQLRRESEVPVIMLTSKNTEMDEVLSMSFGADDFVAKPYNPSILLLHMEAVFKRFGGSGKESTLAYGELTMDVARGMLRVGDKSTELTKNEAGILGYLLQNQGRIVTRDELISYLWDSEEFVDDNTLTVNINRVRKKLEELGFEDMIKTKRGQGYLLA
ncbi:MAG: response regulator transcription factor [Wujia sp.]